MKNKLVVTLLLLVLTFLIADGVAACVVPDHTGWEELYWCGRHINAVYWNPAGLVQLEESEITWTRTLNNRILSITMIS